MPQTVTGVILWEEEEEIREEGIDSYEQ